MSKKITTINGRYVGNALGYVFDGCHKFYIVEDEADRQTALKSWGVEPKPLTDDMFRKFLLSCPPRFIETVKLEKVVPQTCEADQEVEFEFEDETIGIYSPDAKYEQ